MGCGASRDPPPGQNCFFGVADGGGPEDTGSRRSPRRETAKGNMSPGSTVTHMTRITRIHSVRSVESLRHIRNASDGTIADATAWLQMSPRSSQKKRESSTDALALASTTQAAAAANATPAGKAPRPRTAPDTLPPRPPGRLHHSSSKGSTTLLDNPPAVTVPPAASRPRSLLVRTTTPMPLEGKHTVACVVEIAQLPRCSSSPQLLSRQRVVMVLDPSKGGLGAPAPLRKTPSLGSPAGKVSSTGSTPTSDFPSDMASPLGCGGRTSPRGRRPHTLAGRYFGSAASPTRTDSCAGVGYGVVTIPQAPLSVGGECGGGGGSARRSRLEGSPTGERGDGGAGAGTDAGSKCESMFGHELMITGGSATTATAREHNGSPAVSRAALTVGNRNGSFASDSMASSGHSVPTQPPARPRAALMNAAEAEDEVTVDELLASAQASESGYIDISHLGVEALPDGFTALSPHLEALVCSHNAITRLPKPIANFAKLKILKASHNALATVPPELGQLAQLSELDLGNNLLTALPPTIAALTELRMIVLDANNFTTIPHELLGLPALESLCIAENHTLKTMPPNDVLDGIHSMLAVWRTVRFVLKISIDNQPPLVAALHAHPARDLLQKHFLWNKIFPDMVLPHLYLGSLRSAQTPMVYQELGIRFVVTCGRNMQINSEGVERLELAVEDVEEQSLVPYFEQFLEFMGRTKGRGNVLVHCFAGLSRSVTMVLCYLVKEAGMRLDDAMVHVLGVRPNVHPNKTFMRELISYDRAVHGEGARALDMEHLGEKRTELRLKMMQEQRLGHVQSEINVMSCDA